MKRLVALFVLLCALVAARPAAAEVVVTVRPGAWCDVVPYRGGVAFVWADAFGITAEWNGAELWRVALPEPILYLDAAAAGDELVAIGQGNQTGRALLASSTSVVSLGESFGQNAVAVGARAGQVLAFIQTSPATYDEVAIATGARVSKRFPMGPTSQGFRDIVDGEPIFGDLAFRTVIRGYSLHEPTRRGDATVGQWSAGPFGIGVVFDEGPAFTVYQGVGFEPHLARLGDTLAIATRGGLGAVLAIVTPPYPPTEPISAHEDTAPPAPAPAPPTDPAPTSPAPPEGMPDRAQVLRDLRKEYPALLDQRQAGELMARLVYALRGEGFGLLKKAGGNNCPIPNSDVRVSCDIVLHKPTSTWCDVLGSGPDVDGPGPSSPTWCAGEAGDITAFFVPPDPGPSTPPTPDPPSGPPPTTTDPGVLARLTALEATIADLRARVAQLEDAPAPSADITEARVRELIVDAFARAIVQGKTMRDRLGLQHDISLGITLRGPQ